MEIGSTMKSSKATVVCIRPGSLIQSRLGDGDHLVGGLYGVSLKGAFFGESMFHKTTDASKVALWALVERLRERNYHLLDTQWLTPHLERFGAIEIPRAQYLELLAESMQLDCQFT